MGGHVGGGGAHQAQGQPERRREFINLIEKYSSVVQSKPRSKKVAQKSEENLVRKRESGNLAGRMKTEDSRSSSSLTSEGTISMFASTLKLPELTKVGTTLNTLRDAYLPGDLQEASQEPELLSSSLSPSSGSACSKTLPS